VRVTRITLVRVDATRTSIKTNWFVTRRALVDVVSQDAEPLPGCHQYGTTKRGNESYRVDYYHLFNMDDETATKLVDEYITHSSGRYSYEFNLPD